MNILLSIFLFFSVVQPPEEPVLDLSDDIAAAVKTGNAANVSKYFSAKVDSKILDKEEVYSKAQAELVLKDFFTRNPVKSFSVLHKSVAKNGDQSIIGNYESSGGKKFRIYFLLKKEAAGFLVQQMRIDPEDE